MRFATVAVVLLFVLVGVTTTSAKKKERQWQTGTLLDTNGSRVYAGNTGSSSGSATTSGDTTYGQANGSSTAIYRVYEDYKIDTADYVYLCRERLKWRWSNPAMVTVNAPVQFAIEKNHLYIKGEDGKEHETTIVKKILKTSKAASPSGA